MSYFVYTLKPSDDTPNLAKMGVAVNVAKRLKGINKVGYAGVLEWKENWSFEIADKHEAYAVEKLVASRINELSRGKVPNLIATKKGKDKFGWGIETYNIDLETLASYIEQAASYISGFNIK